MRPAPQSDSSPQGETKISDSDTSPTTQARAQPESAPAPPSLSQQLFEVAQRDRTQAFALRAASGGRPNPEADALDAHATKFEDKLLEIAAESEIKRESVRHEKWLKEHEHYLAWHLENSRSIIALSQSACRVVVTVNAGAAVALLAFLGNALSKDEHIVARMFAAPLLTFAMGVVVSAIVTASSYFTQFVYGDENRKKLGIGLHCFTVALWFAAIGTFAYACVQTHSAVGSMSAKGEASMASKKAEPSTTEMLKKNQPPPARPPADPPVVQMPVSKPAMPAPVTKR